MGAGLGPVPIDADTLISLRIECAHVKRVKCKFLGFGIYIDQDVVLTSLSRVETRVECRFRWARAYRNQRGNEGGR